MTLDVSWYHTNSIGSHMFSKINKSDSLIKIGYTVNDICNCTSSKKLHFHFVFVVIRSSLIPNIMESLTITTVSLGHFDISLV